MSAALRSTSDKHGTASERALHCLGQSPDFCVIGSVGIAKEGAEKAMWELPACAEEACWGLLQHGVDRNHQYGFGIAPDLTLLRRAIGGSDRHNVHNETRVSVKGLDGASFPI